MDATTTTTTPANDSAPIPITRARKPKGREDLQLVRVELLRPHPQNPRIALNEQVISGIAEQLKASRTFHPSHALVARPLDGEFQIVEGHHRLAAAHRAELKDVPVWIRAMSDDEALLALGFGNAQGELSALEIGLHSLSVVNPAQGRKGIGITAYSARMGIERTSLVRFRSAAEVYTSIAPNLVQHARSCRDKALHLAEIHKVQETFWVDLVRDCVVHSWTVRETAERVRALTKPAASPAPELGTAQVTTETPFASSSEEVVVPAILADTTSVARPNCEPARLEATEPHHQRGADVRDSYPSAGAIDAEDAPQAALDLQPRTSAATSGSDPTDVEVAAHGADPHGTVFTVVNFGEMVLATEGAGGGFVIALELPAKRVVLHLAPGPDGGVVVRVEAAMQMPAVTIPDGDELAGADVGSGTDEGPAVTMNTTEASVSGASVADERIAVRVPQEAPTDVEGKAPARETSVDAPLVEQVDGDERLAGLRRRLRGLTKSGRTTVSKSAAKIGLPPKIVMGGELTVAQIDDLAREVARVVKRGRTLLVSTMVTAACDST
jgi:ParB family chromosome partitioning protein